MELDVQLMPASCCKYLIRECNLTALPVVFSQLTALTNLELSNNHIASGWQHLAGMRHLEHLVRWQCKLTAVPPVILQLTALTMLDVSSNPCACGLRYLGLDSGAEHLSSYLQAQRISEEYFQC